MLHRSLTTVAGLQNDEGYRGDTVGRYTGPSCRLCRHVGEKLFLKGSRCYGVKCAIERRKRPPGVGDRGGRRRRPSDYSSRLAEKQKLRNTYGMMEKQFATYFSKARHNTGVTGQNLLLLLERRLDNVVFLGSHSFSSHNLASVKAVEGILAIDHCCYLFLLNRTTFLGNAPV